MLRRILMSAAAIWTLLCASALAAPPEFNLLGTLGDPDGDHTTISSFDSSTGALSGHATIQGIGFTVTGSESGNVARYDLTEDANHDYVSHNTNTLSILANGDVGGPGEFTDTNGTHESYDADLNHPAGAQTTTTTAACGTSLCTVTVTGTGGTPTGRATLSAQRGALAGDGTCVLSGGQCSVSYTPPSDGAAPAVLAVYSGDPSFRASQGQAGSARASATQVVCDYVEASRLFSCSAQVGDASAQQPAVTPTGTVHFTASLGAFPDGDTCTLTGTAGSPGIAACSQPLTYSAPDGSVPTGTPPPVSGTYSGDATFAPSSAADQAVYTAPPDDSTPPPSVPDPLAQGTIEDCAAATAPNDDVSTPTPPDSTGQARTDVTQQPTSDDPYCPYRARYTQKEKDAAGRWADYYAARSAQSAQAAAPVVVLATAAALTPEPLISKGAATVFGVSAAVLGGSSADFALKSTQESAVNKDPLDPHWRTIVAARRITTTRLPRLPGPAAERRAVTAYTRALAQDAADQQCMTDAINRATTALGNHDIATAHRQYLAGAVCARDAAASAKRVPALAAHAQRALRAALRAVPAKAKARLLARARKLEADPAGRRTAAGRAIDAITRTIALPSTAAAALRTELAGKARVPRRVTITLNPALTTQAGLLAEQTAQVFAAAAATSG